MSRSSAVPLHRLAAWGCVASLCTLMVGPDGVAAAGASCKDSASCQERLQTLVQRLGSTQESMRSRKQTVHALEGLREGLVRGERVHLPSAQRQHLEKGCPLVGEVSYDAKHRPLSTNISRHMRHVRTIASGSNVRLHDIMPVKLPASAGKSGAGNTALFATLVGDSKLSLFTPDGEARLSDFDLGHKVTHWSLSVNPDFNYVFTGDAASGELRTCMVELVMRNSSDSKGPEDGDEKKRPKKQLTVVAKTTATFQLPQDGDSRRITAVLAVDRGAQPLFLAGDSSGSVAVFFKNGTLKGRIKVTEDPGGVLGLLRGAGQTVLYFSSHSFGFLSVAQVEVSAPPCTGWKSPLFDIASDPSSNYARVVLALTDGDVLVFRTSADGKGKDKTCDLTQKFPRMSTLPFRLHTNRGHIVGLPTPLESTKRAEEYNRELYFFNIAAMEAGYGSGQSRIVTLQASFEQRRLESFALHTGSSGGSGGPPKVHLALQFADQKGGLELYELSLKTPSAPSGGGGGGGASGGGSDLASWLDWIPKVGIFGVTLIGVVFWNIRKVTNKKSEAAGSGGLQDFDDDFLKERLAKKKMGGGGGGDIGDLLGGLGGGIGESTEKLEAMLGKAKARAAGKKAGGGAAGGLDFDQDLGDLASSAKQMEELLASMGGGDDD